MPEQRYFAFARAGEVVFLEASVQWPAEQMNKMVEQINNATKGTGVHVVILPPGLKVARVEVAEG